MMRQHLKTVGAALAQTSLRRQRKNPTHGVVVGAADNARCAIAAALAYNASRAYSPTRYALAALCLRRRSPPHRSDSHRHSTTAGSTTGGEDVNRRASLLATAAAIAGCATAGINWPVIAIAQRLGSMMMLPTCFPMSRVASFTRLILQRNAAQRPMCVDQRLAGRGYKYARSATCLSIWDARAGATSELPKCLGKSTLQGQGNRIWICGLYCVVWQDGF